MMPQLNSHNVDPKFVVDHSIRGKGIVLGMKTLDSGKCLEVMFDGAESLACMPVSAKHPILGYSLWRTPVDVLSNMDSFYQLPKKKSAKAEYTNPSKAMMDLEEYVETVGCEITCESKSSYVDRVIREYEEVTKRPCDTSKIIIVENKPIVPVEWRTTFTAPKGDIQFSYPHDVIRGGAKWRVNYKAFAFYLLIRGFSLGHNSPKQISVAA